MLLKTLIHDTLSSISIMQISFLIITATFLHRLIDNCSFKLIVSLGKILLMSTRKVLGKEKWSSLKSIGKYQPTKDCNIFYQWKMAHIKVKYVV